MQLTVPQLDHLRTDAARDDSSTSDDEDYPVDTAVTPETRREPSTQYASIFRNNLSGSATDLRELHPLPSQIPFLLNMFAEKVNIFSQLVHMPTLNKRLHEMRGPAPSRLTIAEEALMFSIYYAAVTSMDDDDVGASYYLIQYSRTQTHLHFYLFRS